MNDQKCPECGQPVEATSKTAVLNHILAWNRDPWYDKFLLAAPGKTYDIPNLGQVMVVAGANPANYNGDGGYAFQGQEPSCWVVLAAGGKLYRKSGHSDSYCNEFIWDGPFVEVTPIVEEKTSWMR